MKQITKITIALTLIISLASCQSSKTGCYDFGSTSTKEVQSDTQKHPTTIEFTNAVCKP